LKTKKILVIAAIGIALTITAFKVTKSVKTSREQKRISAIVSKGHAVVITNFLNGDTALKVYAVKCADSVWQNYQDRNSINFISFNTKPLNLDMVKKSFQVMENVSGIDSLADKLYQYNKFEDYMIGNKDLGVRWNSKIAMLIDILSEKQKDRIKALVLEKKEDPFWVQRYVSREEMKQLVLTNYFGSKKTTYFLQRSSDPALIVEVAKSIPDSAIVNFEIGASIPSERAMKIVSKLPLDDAYNFCIDAGATDKYIRSLVSSRLSETSGYDLLFYHAVDRITKAQVTVELEKMSTKRMVGDFPSRTTVNIWNFPYDSFAKQLIVSVKSMNDYKMAVDFFKLSTSTKEEEDKWIETLKQKSTI